MPQISRSALVIGMAGAVFFIAAGVWGLVRGAPDAGLVLIFLLFLLIGLSALVGAIVLWRRIGPRR